MDKTKELFGTYAGFLNFTDNVYFKMFFGIGIVTKNIVLTKRIFFTFIIL